MANKITQLKYNQVIDNIAYLIVNYPEALKKLLADYNIIFKGNPSQNDLSDVVIEKLESGDTNFQESLESLIIRLSSPSEDQFLGLIKGAIGIVGGIISRKKNKRRARRAAAASAREEQAYGRSQALAAKRDLQRRMQLQREQQRRREEAAQRRREQEERRRREEASKREAAAESKKKTNMMLMIGGGIAVLGIGAVVFMKSSRPPMPYPQMRPPVMPT